MSHINCNSRKASKRALNGAHRVGAPAGRRGGFESEPLAAPSMGAAAMAIVSNVIRSFGRGNK